MDKLKHFLKMQKNLKMIAIGTILVISIILIGISSLDSEEPIESTQPITNESEQQTKNEEAYASQVGKTYSEFSEDEIKESKKAVKLAEDYYRKEVGELRDTSEFFAETLKDGQYIVTGIDTLDGRDSRFITLQVNTEEKTVYLVENLIQ